MPALTAIGLLDSGRECYVLLKEGIHLQIYKNLWPILTRSTFIKGIFQAVNLVALPVAYLFVNKGFTGFTYYMDLGIWPFVLAMGLSMLITLLAVTLRSYKVAVANTVDAFKYE